MVKKIFNRFLTSQMFENITVFGRGAVGRLAPQIGDYDSSSKSPQSRLFVGRLAPQIGDYDAIFYRTHLQFKSEDLPHKSGITTGLWHSVG